MNWEQLRQKYPDQWLVVEAIKASTDMNGKRIITDFSVVELCPDGAVAFKKYRELHNIDTCKEYYYLHTSRIKLDIEERKWIGIRIKNADSA